MPDYITPAQATSPETAATLLETCASKWWRGADMKEALRNAASWLREQVKTNEDLHRRLASQEKAFRKSEKEGSGLTKRTQLAINEMKHKSGKTEVPVYVVLSPAQYAILTDNSWDRVRKLCGLRIVVARGVSGPFVLTQKAYDGFSRNSPELDIRHKTPAEPVETCYP